MGGINKSRARIFRPIIQAIFKDGRANHESGHIRLPIRTTRPLFEKAAGQVRDCFKGFEITPIDRNRLYPEFAHPASLH